ncbi:MAG: dTMP kinase [Burkholderiales bacterium]|jgi:dTMP kinase|nr:dTMP kinase [Burkholderiales bacterium]
MKKGLFISVEGIDGAGKSTHVNFICEYLKSKGKTVVVTREPGGTPLGEQIRNLLLHSTNMHHNTELLLMFASRQELIEKIIFPNLKDGICVVADRFVDASLAYQGAGRGLGMAKVKQLINLLEPVLTTDLTFLFNVPLSIAVNRIAKNRNKDRIEEENEDFFTKVQNAYLDIAKAQPDRMKVINTNRLKSETRNEIIQHLDYLLDKQNDAPL